MSNHLPDQFRRFFDEEQLRKQKPFLLAISGGLDSVVLASLCREIGISFVLAHSNFGLRGEESERDEAFVRSLAYKLGVEVLVRKMETNAFATAEKLSIQDAARKLRYAWFDELLQSGSYQYLLLAHHADDNIETALFHFLRGTGLKGLTGMPARTDKLLRPMLRFRRSEIMAYALEKGLEWVEDSSNSGTDYTRNFLRHKIIPSIKEQIPQADENILRNIARFEQVHNFYRRAVDKSLQGLLERKGDTVCLPVRKLQKLDFRVLIYEIIRQFGFGEKQVEEVVKLMKSGSGRYIGNEEWQILRHRAWLVIAPVSKGAEMILLTEDNQTVYGREGILSVKSLAAVPASVDMPPHLALLDGRDIRFPLIVRKWKAGDYFYPLGMRKKKKVARFLIDIKMPKHEKERVWVVESGGRIIWVAGHRIDDRFRVTPSTNRCLLLTYERQGAGL